MFAGCMMNRGSMRSFSLIAVILLTALGSQTAARPELTAKGRLIPLLSGNYCYQRISDTGSTLWLAFSNRMAIGHPFADRFALQDDEEQTDDLPRDFRASFSGPSGGEYLYGAGLWVGGIKGIDTLVSHAFDFTFPIPELIPAPCPEGEYRTVPGLADIEHVATAYDTIIAFDTLYRCQIGDCHDWYPLGIQVTSHSYSWVSPPYDRMVIMEYSVKNIDSTPIEKGWVGIYTDADVGGGSDASAGDLSGLIGGTIDGSGRWVDLNLAYSLDMDGDPHDMAFDAGSCNGAFGVQVLGLSKPGYKINFNWWVAGSGAGPSWGPRKADSILRNLGDADAAPYGDSNKYYIMSNGERDYHQIEIGLPHPPDWLEARDSDTMIAYGRDTRFIISAGPFDLAPQEEVTFTVAYVGAQDVIRNSYVNSWFKPTNRSSVSDYYEILHLDDLKAAGLAAATVYKQGFTMPPPGPPSLFRLVSFDDKSAAFVWSATRQTDLAGYHLLRKTGSGPWQVAGMTNASDTVMTVAGLDPMIPYQFALAAIDGGGAVGKPSAVIHLRTGLPHPPAYVTGTSRGGLPLLYWPPSTDSDVGSYQVYRVNIASHDTVHLASIADTTYGDIAALVGYTYDYYVTALTIDGRESMPSPPLRLIPLLLTSGILVINQNPGHVTANVAFDPILFDSLAATALADIGYTYRRYDDQNPVTLQDLARYSLVILSAENLEGYLTRAMADVLEDYLINGGKTVLILSQASVGRGPTSTPQVIHYEPLSFFSRYLMVDSCYIGPLMILPGYRLAGDLIGADPLAPGFPGQTWDSVRANRIGYYLPDGLPYGGAVWPHPPAEPIYAYRSGVADSSTAGRINGIRYKGNDYALYLLNFPLSLMRIDSAAVLLRHIVADLNEEFICGDVNGDFQLDIADAAAYSEYLYWGIHPPALERAGDLDCDGQYTLGDLLVLINFLFRKGPVPLCCR